MKGQKGREMRSFISDLAGQRIERLFQLAAESCDARPDLANRYVWIARRISMRHRVGIPRELKRNVCKQCYCYLKPGSTSRVRTDGRNVIITCISCGGIRRYPYKKIK
ncbi:MAG TPA: ribonuclease P protein component 4 [Methanocella sp.]|nr:ribonuclease P protein component 4 [Methanocella sp.]